MRKIFLLTALLLMTLTASAFAAEDVAEQKNEPYIYTSDFFKYTIACPIEPVAVVRNPWQDSDKRGEMLVFANDGWNIQYAYMIQLNAFDGKKIPDFNKADKATLDEYLEGLKKSNGFEVAEIVNLTKENKGVYAVTAKKIEVFNEETGEVEGEFVADRQDIYTFFRTPAGRCVAIQLVCENLNKDLLNVYRYGVATFKDNFAAKLKNTDKKSKSNKKSKKDKKAKDDKAVDKN